MSTQLGNRVAWLLVGALSGVCVTQTLVRDYATVCTPETAAPIITLAPVGVAPSGQPDLEDFFRAIAHEESGTDDTEIGDKGASRGRYQIGLDYWRDAWGLDRTPVTEAMRARYCRDVTDPSTARCTMLAYWQRYCPAALEAGDWETLARVHNGGPRGAEKQATEAYAARVMRAMKE